MTPPDSTRPVFGQPGWRRRMAEQYGWDKEFKAAGFILLLIFLSLVAARADDGPAPAAPDPKDMAPVRSESPADNCVRDLFLPLPAWSRFEKMPPLPGVLTPMGRSPESEVKPAPAAVAETKPDGAPPPKPAPKPKAPEPDPDQVAISPFLQWIKDHPKDAVAEAHREAAAESGAPAPAPGTAPATAPAPADPYWMPPMIDAGGAVPADGGGSAAIYSRPQR